MAQQVLSLPEIGSTTNRFAGIRVTDLTADEADSVISLALSVLARKHRRGATLTSPDATRSYLRLEIGERHNELFGVLFLDNRHRVIAKEELFYGTIDGASVHPRVVVARALALNAAAVMFYHYVARHIMGVMCPVFLCASSGRIWRTGRSSERCVGT
jgi:DNA repair protein RadC